MLKIPEGIKYIYKKSYEVRKNLNYGKLQITQIVEKGRFVTSLVWKEYLTKVLGKMQTIFEFDFRLEFQLYLMSYLRTVRKFDKK